MDDNSWVGNKKNENTDPGKIKNDFILRDINQIEKRFPGLISGLFEWENIVILRIDISVNLPSRGTKGGLPILNTEPILLFYDQVYPYSVPEVRSDRIDFPKEELPHINPTWPGMPAHLCLHRGDIKEWFAHHTIIDLINRTQEWLEDAAKGELVKINEYFEPTRLEWSHVVGEIIYRNEKYSDFILSKWEETESPGHYFLGCLAKKGKEDHIILSLAVNAMSMNVEGALSKTKTKGVDFSESYASGLRVPGVLAWPNRNNVIKKYFGELPRSIEDLFSWCLELGIDSQEVIVDVLQKHSLVLVIIAVPRERTIVNTNSNLEFIHFLLYKQSKEEGGGILVQNLFHREPITQDMARKLSNAPNVKSVNPDIILIGCGALGSKIGLHLGRAGFTNLRIIDFDQYSPHNVIRHALLGTQIGEYKSLALAKELKLLYAGTPSPDQIRVMGENENILKLLSSNQELIKNGEAFIIDSSISTPVFEKLTNSEIKRTRAVIRTEISYRGKIGLTLIEGQGRSPRLDDLRSHLYMLAFENKIIEAWLSEQPKLNDHEQGVLEEIPIGMGCNSPTMKLADDVISYHAAASAHVIRKTISRNHKAGIQLSYLDIENDGQGLVEFIDVPRFKRLYSEGYSWMIKISPPCEKKLYDYYEANLPNETGGVLMGRMNMRSKVIHITDIIGAPKDSKSSPYYFIRGTQGLRKEAEAIEKKTAGQISFVGEWHSHTNGSNTLSKTDNDTASKLKAILDPINMATLLLIVNKDKLTPHVL
jgi:predicted ThiF/HesA family dinucleotide-utilizing enzyme/proteasome lid subunit RPN8/RPN11